MPDVFHKIQISDEDYEKAAIKWLPQFLLMPLFACEPTLKYMTGQPGVTSPVKLPSAEGNAQFAPYRHDRHSEDTTKIDFRELQTYLGNVRIDFEPLQYIRLLIGQGTATLGDGQMQAPTAKLVIETVMKSLGHHLHNCLFTAKRNASGDTTADLFDGWGTILDKEIEAETITTPKNNLLRLSEEITSVNAVDIAKEIERSCDPHLRAREKFLFCDPAFADNYNDAYLVSHNAVPYNKKYEQPVIEGSGNKTTIVPLECLTGTDKYIVTTKDNMLYGYDNMSDLTRMEVKRYDPWVMTIAAAMFFGTQFRTIDPRFLKVIKLKGKTVTGPVSN